MPKHIGETLTTDANLHIESSAHYATVEDRYKTQYSAAVEALKADPENDNKLLDLLIVRQEYFNTIERYDATGAYNAREFHEDIGKYFETRGSYKQDENGLLQPLENDSEYTFLGVTFNSLAAANKIRHDQGDKALAESVIAMEKTLLDAGLSLDDFKIYRLKGSDFVVRLTTNKVPDLESLKSNITEARTPTGETISKLYGGIKPKLVNVDTTRSDTIEMFNNLQNELKNRGDDPLTFDSQGSLQKYLTGLTLDLLEAKREQAFLFSMLADTAKHTWTLLESRDTEKAKEAIAFYNLFAARFFTGYSDLSSLENIIPSPEAYSVNDFYKIFDRKVKLASAQLASERVFGAREEKEQVTDILSKLSLEKLTQDTQLEEVIRVHVVSGLSSEIADASEFSLFAENAKDIKFRDLFEQFETKQKKVMANAHLALDHINYVIADGTISSEESITLGNAISGFNNYLVEGGEDYFDSTVSIGGKNYDLYDLLLRDVSTWDVPKAERVKKLFNEILYTHERRYDIATGLPKKETFLRESDAMIMNGILNNENFTYVMGDLAFLRHANEAGRITGNASIAVTSYSFEHAAMNSNVEYTIARYGGDEFTGVLSGKVENISNVEAKFAQDFFDTSQQYNIPAGREVINYLPHPVTLNIGFCSREWGMQGVKELLAAGTFGEHDAAVLQNAMAMLENGDTEGLRNLPQEQIAYFSTVLSKTMARIADRSMEISKAQHRACYLYGMYERLKIHNIPKNTKAWQTFSTIFSYSQKAIPDVTLANFEELYNELQTSEGLSQQQKEDIVIDRFGEFKDRTDKGRYEAILKELVNENLTS